MSDQLQSVGAVDQRNGLMHPVMVTRKAPNAADPDVPHWVVWAATWDCRATMPDYLGCVIDLSSGSAFKLNPCKTEDMAPAVAPLGIPGEQIVSCFKAARDFVVSPTSAWSQLTYEA
jgi:hypothetical protein